MERLEIYEKRNNKGKRLQTNGEETVNRILQLWKTARTHWKYEEKIILSLNMYYYLVSNAVSNIWWCNMYKRVKVSEHDFCLP